MEILCQLWFDCLQKCFIGYHITLSLLLYFFPKAGKRDSFSNSKLYFSFHSLFSIYRRAAPSAEFSVDRTRHLMSFLTMLGPSPDWNVGLSAEDLCTKECGWVQKVVQDLIPWDAGTDSGVTYEVCETIYLCLE